MAVQPCVLSALLITSVASIPAATIGTSPPLAAKYNVGGTIIGETGGTIHSGGDVEYIGSSLKPDNYNGAFYSYSYDETFPFNGSIVTSNLAKTVAYAKPGSMGYLAFVGGPAVGATQSADTVISSSQIIEDLAPSNGQLTGSISIAYNFHGNQTLKFGYGSVGQSALLITNLSSNALNPNGPNGELAVSETTATPDASVTNSVGSASGRAIFAIVNGVANVNVYADSYGQCQYNSENATCQVLADFYNTFDMSGAQVYDASGALEPEVNVISASGFDYNAPLAASGVPEPKSVVLLGLGVLALGVHYLTRRSLRSRRFGISHS